MPFVKLSYIDAVDFLKSEKNLKDYLRQKKINPYEFELLKEVRKIHVDESRNTNKVEQLCKEYFSEESDKAFELLIRFTKSQQKRVPWVLFSRTFQLIPYHEEDPFEGYQPTSDVVVFIQTREKLVEKNES